MDLIFGFFTFFLVLYLIYLAHIFFIQSKRQEGMENGVEEDETKLKMKKINENSANKGNARKTDDEKPATGVKNMNPLPNFIEPQPQLQSQHQPQQYHHQIPAQNLQSQNQSQNQNPQNQNQNPQNQNQNQNQNQSNMDNASVVVENMEDIQEPFGEEDGENMTNMMSEEYLHSVYVRNTTGYKKAGLGKVKPLIPLIKLLTPPKFKLKGGGKLFEPLLKGITKPFTDIIGGFIKAANEIIKIVNMIIELINKAVFYSECAFTLLINFFIVPCLLWYILNLLGTILYLIPFFMFTLFGVNDKVEDYIWGPIYLLDEFIYEITGFHFAHFPDSINKACFSCPSKFTILGIPYIGDFFNVSFNFDFDSNIIPNYYA